ncbi:hypothetical protein B5M09_011774, partial [Aphanomyces astaci]
ELVLAAWEVFELEEDKDELADTLLRIVRFKRQQQQAPPSLDSICRELVERHLLTDVQCQGLLALWEAKNDAIIGAVEAFHADKDMRELVDTLLLVVKHAGLDQNNLSPSSNGKSPVFARGNVPTSPVDDAAADVSLEELHPLSPRASTGKFPTSPPLSPPSYGTFETANSPPTTSFTLGKIPTKRSKDSVVALLDALLRQSLLTNPQHQLLSNFRNDSRVQAAVQSQSAKESLVELYQVLQWETNRQSILHKCDEVEFVDTLMRLSDTIDGPAEGGEIAQSEAPEVASSMLALHATGKLSPDVLEQLQMDDPKVLAAFDDELVDTLNRIATTGRNNTRLSMDKQLLHLVYELQLPADELAALKLAISTNDEVVQAAVDVFQIDHDEVLIYIFEH